MKKSEAIRSFEQRLGYEFSNLSLLVEALTHSSIASDFRKDNQRLEFLGDRVLGLVMAEALLEIDQTAPEGTLAPRFNALVRKETCAEVARQIELGGVLKIGRSEMLSGGRRKDALLGDGMEAVIAAIYKDGGFEIAKTIIIKLWGDRIKNVKVDARDAKTMLQEWAQARGQNPPNYEVISRSGPDHAPDFLVKVILASGETSEAMAGSKRQAEQMAAKALLQKIGEVIH
ncbi:MAG: ribonuclease III [Rhodobacterales bacterium]|nr:ribonuclease III [Rhodobacterales bacterium]NCX27418.1 ribonuclease III [Rhodobacterales bacterium]NCX53333.1 ribonuclease III [Rhodobacterales bacterium]NCX87080.1 ribonuclease III [Paracoccaceae bacterium]